MKTFLLIILLCGISILCMSQSFVSVDTLDNSNVHIITDDFEGVIFNPNSNSYYVDSSETKWMPTIEDVLLCDNIIRKYVTKKESNVAVVLGDSPIISDNFDKFVRQYMGYVDNHGRKKMYVKFVWKEAAENDDFPWLEHFVGAIGGGTYFWGIKVDLKRKKCYDFMMD